MAVKKREPTKVAPKPKPVGDCTLILSFLTELRNHNDRAWFEANRPRYEEARASFEAVVGALLDRLEKVDDLGGVAVKDCLFRINRDVRFTKDKAPYKTSMSALLGADGRKSGVRAYYFHLEPEGGSMLGGGLYDPSPAELGTIRQAIALDAKPLKKLMRAPAFVRHFGELGGESLKTAPQGFAKDHPEIELLRKKQFLVVHRLDDGFVASKDLAARCIEVFTAMKPFLRWLEGTLET